MSLFDFFRKRKPTSEEYEEDAWDKIQNERDSLNMHDPAVRESYVRNCLEQMRESSNELDRISGEYSLVTGYLTDMEEIEGLKDDKKANMEKIARHLHDLKKERDSFNVNPDAMTNAEYERMEKMADDAPDGIKKLKEEETYRDKVKSDLRRLDKERKAYKIRKHEVSASIENYRGVATITMVAAAVLVVILFLLQVLLKFDVTVGYYIAVAVTAVSLTIIYIKYTDFISEKKRVENTINELILLENKVKIRYVNNRNLLDYLYSKFDVTSAEELDKLYARFLKEKDDRRRLERNEVIYSDEKTKLLTILRSIDIRDPEVWMHHTDALYDKKEMVEIRHDLIGRRQKLRKQMEYNEQIALEASDEIKAIINEYPQYAEELMELVNTYE